MVDAVSTPTIDSWAAVIGSVVDSAVVVGSAVVATVVVGSAVVGASLVVVSVVVAVSSVRMGTTDVTGLGGALHIWSKQQTSPFTTPQEAK